MTDALTSKDEVSQEIPLHAESTAAEVRDAVQRLASVPMNISLEGWQDISAILLGGANRLARLERAAHETCGNCDNQQPCQNQYGICSRHGGRPHHSSETECSWCVAGMNSFTDPDTGKKMHARNGIVALCTAEKTADG